MTLIKTHRVVIGAEMGHREPQERVKYVVINNKFTTF